MVTLSLFENSIKNQTIRTIIALIIVVPSDLIYLFLSERSFERLRNHLFAYFNVWITLAIVFGVSIVSGIEGDSIKNYALYGLLIGLLIYVPLYNWIISCGSITNFTQLLSVTNVAFGVVLSSFTCIILYLISEKAELLN